MILSRNTYLRIHSTPKPATFAACTASLLPSGLAVLLVAFTTRTTITVDRIHPATVNAQNGNTSRRMWARPRLPHTQYLLSRNAGTDTRVTAMRFDCTGGQPRRCRKMTSRIWVVITPNNDVAE